MTISFRRTARTLDRITGDVLESISMLCLVTLFVLLLINVISRSFQLWSFAWLDEVVQGLFAWMVFTGTAALWRHNEHFRVDWLELALPGRARHYLRFLTVFLSLVFLFFMTWKGWDLTMRSRALTPILDLPTAYFYAAIPLAGGLMMAYSLRDLLLEWQSLFSYSTKDEHSDAL